METEFMPRFTPEDIINLPKFNIYLKLLIDGVTSQPFSAITLPPIANVTHSEEKVIKISRERYAHKRAEIEEKIVKWSGMDEIDDEQMYKEAEEKKKAAKQSRKPRHEYNCTRCNKDMVLPVELDRSRPIYCEDCIEIVREERKSGKKKKQVRKKEKPKQEAPPKPSEGEVIEKAPEEPSISLGDLPPASLRGSEATEANPVKENEKNTKIASSSDRDQTPRKDTGGDGPKKKRKRKRKKKKPSSGGSSQQAPKQEERQPKKNENKPDAQSGTLKTGQSIKFD